MTGTPTFLVKLLQERGLEPSRLQDEDCRDLKAYRLGYPNLEVKEAFLEFLYPYYING